jgi:purine-binding chemotaxis protein CheW
VRGQAVPVVDLRRKFGLPDCPATVHSRILILELTVEHESYVIGGLADSVHDVIELSVEELAPPPRLASGWRSEVITGLAQCGAEFIVMLDVQRVFALEDLSVLQDSSMPLLAANA